jgi:6-phosphogluconolactonase
MKLRKPGEILLAAAVLLSSALLITACGVGAVSTIDFLYITAAKSNPGQVAVYKIDGGSGILRQLPQSPYPTGGRNPITEVPTANGKNLYVANRDENTIVQFAVGTDGKLYPQTTVNTPGGFPVGLAVNKSGTLLYVVDTYQPGYTDATPGPGAVVVYPIYETGPACQTASGAVAVPGALCQPIANGLLPYFPVGFAPIGINVLPDEKTVYVVSRGAAAQPGRVYEFSTDTTGKLTPIGTGFIQVGVAPTAITSTPSGSFVYVTDSGGNKVYGFAPDANGNLLGVPSSPFNTDVQPIALTVDQTSKFLYVVNYTTGSVLPYIIKADGSLTVGTSFATGAGPTCAVIEPKQNKYMFVSNFLDGTVSGYQINPTTGALVGIQGSPYPTPGLSTCAASVVNQ